LDTGFGPQPDGPVHALALSDTNLYAGGNFTSIGGSNRTCLAAVSTLTGTATALDARLDAGGIVRALALANGQIYAAGDFAKIGAVTRRKLAAIDPTTGVAAPDWDPDVGFDNGAKVLAMAVSPHVAYVGGIFNGIGGENRMIIGSVPFARSAPTAWTAAVVVTGNISVQALSYGAKHLVVGGDFAIAGGRFLPNLAVYPLVPSFVQPYGRLSADGTPGFAVFDGDAPTGTVEIQARPGLVPSVWETIASRPVTGTEWTLEDTTAGEHPIRLFRTVQKR
jgi:hypothetical protein